MAPHTHHLPRGDKLSLESEAFRRPVNSSNKSIRMALPPQIAQTAEFDLLSVERILSGLWQPKVINPIEIPRAPENFFYENYSEAFTRSYFYKNLYKCLIASHLLKHHLAGISQVTDLGAGTGVFGIALSMICRLESMTMIDRSYRQIENAKIIFERLNFPSHIEYQVGDFSSLDTTGLDVICSYALGESVCEKFDVLQLIRKSKTFTLIDTPFLISLLEPIAKEMDLRVVSGVIEFYAGEEISHLIEGGGGRFAYFHSSGPK
ncbi:hypothetical protein CHX26_11895 [Porphyrobacter sp. HT-58-2]|nr:hypothetical protein CHX26_11895 [Porphyrobacter sp. HT-58-2]